MKGITYCGACADYDIKKHRCKRGAKLESNPQDKFFDDCPLPDAAPVVYGQWIIGVDDDDFDVKCSKCGWTDNFEVAGIAAVERIAKTMYYCQNCGARMDGGDSDAAD